MQRKRRELTKTMGQEILSCLAEKRLRNELSSGGAKLEEAGGDELGVRWWRIGELGVRRRCGQLGDRRQPGAAAKEEGNRRQSGEARWLSRVYSSFFFFQILIFDFFLSNFFPFFISNSYFLFLPLIFLPIFLGVCFSWLWWSWWWVYEFYCLFCWLWKTQRELKKI